MTRYEGAMRTLLAPLALLLIANVDPNTIPQPLKTMLQAAMESGNESDVSTVVKYARIAAPESADEIGRQAQAWIESRHSEAETRLATAGFLDLMRGKAELGGFATTGNTNNIGITGALDLTREGLQWRHKLRMLAEYQENARVATREHYLAAFEPNFKVDDRLYIYGAAQFESDRFLGYTERYSASAGAGYSAIKRRAMTLDLELGPAFRSTDFTDDTLERNFAARGSLDFDWKLTSGLVLSQDASAYVQSANSTVTGKTALAAKLIGPLSAQVSYAVSYESRPAEGRTNTDTTSRASLVYAF